MPACIPILALAAFTLASGYHPALAQTWDKVKEDLASRGIMPSVVYDGNLLTDAVGGLKQDSIFQGNLYLQLRIDSEKAFGFPGMKIYLSELASHGPNPENGLVGDAQGVSNLTARPGFRSYEGWVQYNFLDNRWSVLVGQYDLATEFYRSQTANLFFNTAFGTGTEFGLSGLEGDLSVHVAGRAYRVQAAEQCRVSNRNPRRRAALSSERQNLPISQQRRAADRVGSGMDQK
jgi:porin